jgi:putative toxin-antitoxin system antitoxin component (TIGR02293 family)
MPISTQKGSISALKPRSKKHKKNATKSRKLEMHMADLHLIPPDDKIVMIKNGVSKNDLIRIKSESDLDYDRLSKILSVSRAKLLNKKAQQKFDKATSERILLLADLIGYGQTVFEDKEKFNEWLRKPSKGLGGRSPVEMMDTFYGILEVKKEIGRIEHGVF